MNNREDFKYFLMSFMRKNNIKEFVFIDDIPEVCADFNGNYCNVSVNKVIIDDCFDYDRLLYYVTYCGNNYILNDMDIDTYSKREVFNCIKRNFLNNVYPYEFEERFKTLSVKERTLIHNEYALFNAVDDYLIPMEYFDIFKNMEIECGKKPLICEDKFNKKSKYFVCDKERNTKSLTRREASDITFKYLTEMYYDINFMKKLHEKYPILFGDK